MVVGFDTDVSYRNEINRNGGHSTFLQEDTSRWVDCHKMEGVADST